MQMIQTMDDTLTRVGQYIRQRRESLQMTQNDLADAIKNAGYDIDSPAIARTSKAARYGLCGFFLPIPRP